MTTSLKRTLSIGFYFLILNLGYAQGDSCSNPIDLNPFIPITGNGTYNLTVNNSLSSQFYKYTATQVGTIEMSSAFSNVPGDGTFDSWLKVYDKDCNLIFNENNTPGLLGGAEFATAVEVGDIYIFEWVNQDWAGVFDVEFIYHVPVTGEDCNDPVNLVLGSNTVDYWFGDQYYTYTASKSGLLELSTCGLWNSGGSNIELLDACNGTPIGQSSDECDYDTEGWESVTYNITKGETVLIKMVEALHKHYDYTFNANFTIAGNNCATPIEMTNPGIYEVINDTSSDKGQWYKFKATKSGAAVITTGHPSMANGENLAYNEQTNIEVYNNCNGAIIASNDDYPGLFGNSLVNINLIQDSIYYFLLIDEYINGDYSFELFYEDDLITGIENNPLVLDLGINEEFGHIFHTTEQWFSYEFSQSGTFTLSFTKYFDGIATNFSSLQNLEEYYNDDDDNYPGGFTYSGTLGETLLFKIDNFNSTFTASFTSDPLTVKDNQLKSINIFPNPASNKLIIENSKGIILESVSLKDITGKSIPIQWNTSPQNKIELDISNAQQGIYFLQINNSQTIKFMKR